MGTFYVGCVFAWSTQKVISHPDHTHGGLRFDIWVIMGNGLGLEQHRKRDGFDSLRRGFNVPPELYMGRNPTVKLSMAVHTWVSLAQFDERTPHLSQSLFRSASADGVALRCQFAGMVSGLEELKQGYRIVEGVEHGVLVECLAEVAPDLPDV